MAIQNPKGPHHVEHETGGSDALATLDGSILLTGTIPDARHSANIPRLSATNTFSTGEVILAGSLPFARVHFRDTTQPTDQKLWMASNTGGNFYVQAINDAGNTVIANALQLNRAGDAFVGHDVYEKARTTPMGHWIDIPFSAANFAAVGGTWTVSAQNAFAYMLIGKTLWMTLQIVSSTISGTPSNLTVALPAGFGANRATTTNALVQLAGVYENGMALAAPAQSIISVYRSTLQNFAAGTLRVDLTIPVSVT